MRKSVSIFIIASFAILWGCSPRQNSKTIHFLPLSEKDFNYPADTTFIPPTGKEWEQRRKWHDSCMGTSFVSNAVFMRTKDTFRLGCIVNRKTMKVVKNLDFRDFFGEQPSTMLTALTKPCYEKLPFSAELDSFFRTAIILKLPQPVGNLNDELNNLMHTSMSTQVRIGSWVNLELTDVLGKVLDTTSDAAKLDYKETLLQPDNMILVRSSSITDVTYFIHTSKPISNKLKTVLVQKPVATVENLNLQPKLFFIDDTNIQLDFTGYFQVIGQFMKCELQ